ncbi:MAG: hypothetical protein AAB895_04295 [Patescibacteria group bacterium]
MNTFLDINIKKIGDKGGYTIIETMIAVSLLLVVTITGMGALLNANLIHQKSESSREIMDSLSFIMEDMSKNLRTGTNYHCVNDGNFTLNNINTPKSCATGGAIAFENGLGDPSINNDQWIYKIESVDGIQPFNIFKSVDSGATWVQLNPNEVEIDSLSSFSVVGAEPPDENGGGDNKQPFVTMKLIGEIKVKNTTTPFTLQTSVSQRSIDI